MDQESLRGLLNIDRADRVFQDLLRHVADQGKEIAELRTLVGRCATAEVVHAVGATLQKHVKALDGRCDVLEHAVVVPRIETDETSSSGDSSSSRPSHGRRRSGAAIGGSSRSGTSVGEAVAALQRTAVALGEQLHTKADSTALATSHEQQTQQLKLEIRGVREECATKTFANALETNQLALTEQLQATNAVLATKADKSVLSSMETTCRKLMAFESHVQDSAAAVATLQAQTAAATTALRQLGHGLQQVQALADNTAAGLKTTASQADADATAAAAHALQQQLKDLEARTSIKTQSLTEGLGECRRDLTEHVSETSSTTASLRQHLSSVESFIASMPQPGACDKLVDESTLQQTVASIRATLDRKAGLSAFVALRNDVASHAARSDKLEQELSLATKFVDWFAERGDAYEHNLRAVDTQLGGLALRERRRQPFDGQTRFTPLDLQGNEAANAASSANHASPDIGLRTATGRGAARIE